MNPANKISGFESFFLVGICLVFDLIDLIAMGIGFLPVVGLPLAEIIKFTNNILISLTIMFWLTMKGVRQYWFLGGSIVEAVPLLNSFPVRTVTMVITIYVVNKQTATA